MAAPPAERGGASSLQNIERRSVLRRDFYTLAELSERWACTPKDLIHLGIQELAQVCVNLIGIGVGTVDVEVTLIDDSEAPEVDISIAQQEAKEAAAKFTKWGAVATVGMPEGIFMLSRAALRFIERPNGVPHELSDAIKVGGSKSHLFVFGPPVSINLEHLCMLHEEVTRLDREVFGDIPSLPPKGPRAEPKQVGRPENKDLGARERDTLLKLLIGMAIGGYGYDPSANRSDVAGTISADLASRGLSVSDDTVRKWLQQATELLPGASP